MFEAIMSIEGREDLRVSRDCLNILAGPDEFLFTIHKDNLSYSAYFDRLLKLSFDTEEAFTLKLPNVSLETLELVSGILQGEDWNPDTDEYEEQCDTLVRIYVLSAHLEIAIIQNMVIDQLYYISTEKGRVPLKTISYVWENTDEESKLRHFLLELACYRAGEGGCYDFEDMYSDAPDLPKEFYLTLLYKLNALNKNMEDHMREHLGGDWTGWNDDADLVTRVKFYTKDSLEENDTTGGYWSDSVDNQKSVDEDDDNMEGSITTKEKGDEDEQMRDVADQEEREGKKECQLPRRSKRNRDHVNYKSYIDEEPKPKKVALQKAVDALHAPPQSLNDLYAKDDKPALWQRGIQSMKASGPISIDLSGDSEEDSNEEEPLPLKGQKGFKEVKVTHDRYHVVKYTDAGPNTRQKAQRAAKAAWNTSHLEEDSDEYSPNPSKTPSRSKSRKTKKSSLTITKSS